MRLNLCKIFGVALLSISGVGCSELRLASETEGEGTQSVAETVEATAERSSGFDILVERRSIPHESTLSPLVEELDRVAVERSVHLQNLQAALAERRAAEFGRYPRIVPTASLPVDGGDASIGVNIEQTVWDGGRTRTRLDDADLTIAEARVKTWQERNETIHSGLEAFVDIQRYSSRILVLSELQEDLDQLGDVLRVRVEGGVADRGEQLRMSLSLQEMQRDIVSDQAELRAVQAILARLVSPAAVPSGVGLLGNAQSVCSRDWPVNEAPAVAEARVRLMQAEINYDAVRARRLPSLVLSAGSSYSSGSLSDPSVSLSLDASDMLGLGRRGSIDSAAASRTGALRSYELQQEDTDAELQILEQDYLGYISDISQLEALQGTNAENLLLYQEQVVAGSIPVAEGISLYKESANTRLDLIDARARVIQNCLESARVRGTLAPFGVSNE